MTDFKNGYFYEKIERLLLAYVPLNFWGGPLSKRLPTCGLHLLTRNIPIAITHHHQADCRPTPRSSNTKSLAYNSTPQLKYATFPSLKYVFCTKTPSHCSFFFLTAAFISEKKHLFLKRKCHQTFQSKISPICKQYFTWIYQSVCAFWICFLGNGNLFK